MQVRDFEYSDMDGVMYCAEQFQIESGYDKLADFDRKSFEQFIRMLISNPGGFLLVAVEDDIVLGIIASIVGTLMFNSNVKFSQEMFWWVDPEWRSSGIGSKLLNAYEKKSKELGASILMMAGLNGEEFKTANKVYEHRGYLPADQVYIRRLDDETN